MVPFNSDRKHKNRKVEPETMDRIYDMVKTQYKTGPVMKYDDYLTDSPSIFKHEGNWYMMYITISKDVSVSGYETHLAKSKDLIDWEQYCTILRRNDRNRWDSKQCAGYAAFVDIEFGKTNEIRKVDDRYYFSYLAGNSDGYEPDPLYMGLAYSVDPTDPSSVTRLEEPILRPDDADAREYERRTLYKSYLFEDIDGITGYRYVNAYNAKDENNKERIYLAVSNDAVNWERYGATPVIDDIKDNPRVKISGDPQIVKIDDIYVMFYFVCEEGKGAYNTFACSYDLVEWTKWTGTPLVQSEHEWENIYAHKPWVLKDKEVVYHFYCAVNKKGERFIALATSKPLQK